MMSEFEAIWLIDTGEADRVWCDSPDPSPGIDPADVAGPYILDADKRIAELQAENERLREELARWRKGECRRKIDKAMEGD